MNLTLKDQNFPQLNGWSLLEKIGLTPREVEIMEWVARGKTNKEIGLVLDISPRTTSKHLEHIYLKFGVTSRVNAVVYFLQMIQPKL